MILPTSRWKRRKVGIVPIGSLDCGSCESQQLIDAGVVCGQMHMSAFE